MSTFDGFIKEFPQLRVDYFRLQPDRPQPLACFLSHVHSDHLTGLVSLKSPFVYCSAATREILLRLETYRHRMNFARGFTEVSKQTYRHLYKLLKPLPLETPTTVELSPGNAITVTLFNANHCTGAVMFLFESASASVLYSGDIRAEPWWVNALAHNPSFIPFVPLPAGAGIKRLDNVYLDTTFAVKSKPYRTFPTKAEGLAEFLRKLQKYPSTTQFYFHAWTFGYEEVMITLSRALGSRIHLDPYRYRIYTSLAKSSNQPGGLQCQEAAAFSGFLVGNTQQPGIFTKDHNVRLHSCEVGSGCWATEPEQGKHVVHIKPIISRHNGEEMQEAGLGGGQGDLDQIHELELGDADTIEKLFKLCDRHINNVETRHHVKNLLQERLLDQPGQQGLLRLDPDLSQDTVELADRMGLERLTHILQGYVGPGKPNGQNSKKSHTEITFPYSRHSSYDELHYLIDTLKPRDVFPCTAPKPQDFTEDRSMQALFGNACYRPEDKGRLSFQWDVQIRDERGHLREEQEDSIIMVDEIPAANRSHDAKHIAQDAETQQQSQSEDDDTHNESDLDCEHSKPEAAITRPTNNVNDLTHSDERIDHRLRIPAQRSFSEHWHDAMPELANAETQRNIDISSEDSDPDLPFATPQEVPSKVASTLENASRFFQQTSDRTRPVSSSAQSQTSDAPLRLHARQEAYDAALGGNWDVVKLSSTSLKRRYVDYSGEI